VFDDNDADVNDSAAEFELQQLKLSVGGKMRGRDDNVKQLQKQVETRPACPCFSYQC